MSTESHPAPSLKKDLFLGICTISTWLLYQIPIFRGDRLLFWTNVTITVCVVLHFGLTLLIRRWHRQISERERDES